MTEKISIIGAGIGGLTSALAFKRGGVNVSIFEGSAEIKPVGAGIIMASNAMQVFQKMGIHDKIEKAGNKISRMKITDARLNALSIVDLRAYEQKYGVHNTAIHRGELQKILAAEVGYENINLSKRLAKIEKTETFELTFEDKSTIESQYVIGADGIKSVVRNQLFGKSTLRNAKQLCWRGICEMELPEKYHTELNEAWGKGKRFGFVKMGNNKVYWYALINSHEAKADAVSLLELFSDFHVDVLKIIAATQKEQILVSEIMDLKPIDKWQGEHVCLVGDAAHATTPNLGQGACQAIEDAYVLGQLLEKGMAIQDIFMQYQRVRQKKARFIVNTSWTLGKMAHWSNPLFIWARNQAFRWTPEAINKKQMDNIFELA